MKFIFRVTIDLSPPEEEAVEEESKESNNKTNTSSDSNGPKVTEKKLETMKLPGTSNKEVKPNDQKSGKKASNKSVTSTSSQLPAPKKTSTSGKKKSL